MFLLCPCLGAACLWDYDAGRIPNFLQFVIFSLGMIYSFFNGGLPEVVLFLVKIIVLGFVGFPLFRLSMIGAGDVKLISLAAGFFPLKSVLWFIFYIFIVAGVFSIIRFIVRKNIRERFLYFVKYMTDVSTTGELKAYMPEKPKRAEAGIVMSGPVLISALMYWGGVY